MDKKSPPIPLSPMGRIGLIKNFNFPNFLKKKNCQNYFSWGSLALKTIKKSFSCFFSMFPYNVSLLLLWHFVCCSLIRNIAQFFFSSKRCHKTCPLMHVQLRVSHLIASLDAIYPNLCCLLAAYSAAF